MSLFSDQPFCQEHHDFLCLGVRRGRMQMFPCNGVMEERCVERLRGMALMRMLQLCGWT